MLLRSTAPLSPLPPATYRSFSSALSASLSAGEWIRPKAVSKDGEEESVPNPFEGAGMEGAMDGMKKQAVMMCVEPSMVRDQADGQGAEYGVDAIHLGILLRLCPEYVFVHRLPLAPVR